MGTMPKDATFSVFDSSIAKHAIQSTPKPTNSGESDCDQHSANRNGRGTKRGLRQKKVLNRQELTRIKSRSTDDLFECKECGKKFAQRGSLKNHLNMHDGRRPYECKHCKKRFTRSGGLTAHMRIHTGDRPYTCGICEKRFALCGTLTTHVRSHTGERPFACKLCEKKFAQRGTLTIHIRSHTGERPYICKEENCGMRFAHRGTLTTHSRTHSGEKPYACSCGKSFSQRSTLNNHKKTNSHRSATNTPSEKSRDSGNESCDRNTEDVEVQKRKLDRIEDGTPRTSKPNILGSPTNLNGYRIERRAKNLIRISLY